MSFKELIINAGSSSLKYQVFEMPQAKVLAKGIFEQIGTACTFTHKIDKDGEEVKVLDKKSVEAKDHHDAITILLETLTDKETGVLTSMADISAVGHRVLHGGEEFSGSVVVDEDVKAAIRKCIPLGPLHNPANLMGIEVCEEIMKGIPQVAVFDTAFHQTMPSYAYMYALPYEYYEKYGIRRYGFHGTSHLYVSKVAAKMLGKPANECNLITLHIGSGASATAIRNGVSVDTSLGMTPLAGLTMGTRPGDLDPGVVLYVMEQLKLTPAQMQTHLSKDSGLKGLTECFADRRDVEENKDKDDKCRLAIQVEVRNVRQRIGAYMAELGRVDALVFTAGVGENDEYLREKFCTGLENLGIKLDVEKNAKTLARKGCGETVISTPDSPVKVFMIPTNEELVIVEDTLAIMNGKYNPNHLMMNYSFAKQNQKQK